MKIVRVWATPVRPPHAPASWLSESLVANPMSLSEDGEMRSLFPFLRGVPQPVDGYLTPSAAPGVGVEIDTTWLDE